MLHTSVLTAYKEKVQRGWDTLYIAIDLHGTIIERYTGSEIKPYLHATEVLKELSATTNVVLILFTSTSIENLQTFYAWCKYNNINFKYLNENPECTGNHTGDFSSKFYFNILLDDRAGFDPEYDWKKFQFSIKVANKMLNCRFIDSCHNSLKHNCNSKLCCLCNNNTFNFISIDKQTHVLP